MRYRTDNLLKGSHPTTNICTSNLHTHNQAIHTIYSRNSMSTLNNESDVIPHFTNCQQIPCKDKEQQLLLTIIVVYPNILVYCSYYYEMSHTIALGDMFCSATNTSMSLSQSHILLPTNALFNYYLCPAVLEKYYAFI